MSEINDSSLTNGTDDCVFPKNHNLLNILQKGISENIEENIALKKETLKLFHNLHIEPEMLFNDIKDSLEKASSILKCKGLLAMNATDLAISVETKKIQDKRKHREERNFALKYDTIFVKTNSLQKKHEQLQKAISSLEKIVANGNQSEETSDVTKILLKKKLKDYEYAVEELNKEIDKLQIQDLDPEVTMARYEEHLELMGKLAQLNEVIGQYKDLPPNLLQARALLETKQQEYEKIKDALEAELLKIRL